MLAACERGEFHIYAVSTIHQAIHILTGVAAGERGPDGYPEGTVLHKAVQLAEEFWRRTLQSPRHLTSVEMIDDEDEVVAPPEELDY